MSVTSRPHNKQRSKAVFASWIGTTIEYYDFSIYGLAAALIFPQVFFPSNDPTVATLLSLSTFAVAYIARPAGAAVFGHFGDRIGRKTTLIVTLLLMGGATFMIGVLPSYAQIGVLAPILLVAARLAQGFSVGGEYGGAVLMTIEHSGKKQGGLFGSIVNTGATAGLVLANVVFLLVLLTPEDAMLSWGWRVPFLFSGVLVLVGLLARLYLEESPEFTEAKNSGKIRNQPVVDVFRGHFGTMILVAFGIIGSGTAFVMTTVYSLSYGTTTLGASRSTMVGALLIASISIFIFLPYFGNLADRIGVRKVFGFGAVVMLFAPFAWFPLLGTGSLPLMILGYVLVFLGYSANYAVVPVYFSRVFPPTVRYAGMSIGMTVGLIGGNAIAPALSSILLDQTGSWVAIACYMSVTALITLGVASLLRIPKLEQEEPAKVSEPSTPVAAPSPSMDVLSHD